MQDDRQLLERYANELSEAAFGELVRRYVNFVYSVALRRASGNAAQAQDVAQLVFTDLARKARSLPKDVVLAGWLHRATRFAVAQMHRAERRRRARELEAVEMNALKSEPAPVWEDLRPVLDEALDRLGRTDRDALLLRFFEQRTLAEVGRALGLKEDAARKRVDRALDKLRAALARRGITTSVAAFSTVISANAVQVAPAGLAAMLTKASFAAATAMSGTTLGVLKLMTMTNLKAVAGAVAAAGVITSVVLQQHAQAKVRAAEDALQRQTERLGQLQAENDRLSILAARADGSRANNLDELLRLRTEVNALRRETDAFVSLQEENRRLRSLRASSANLKTPLEQKEETLAEGMARLNYVRSWMVAFHSYAADHNDHFPSAFDQAARYVKEDSAGAEFPLTTNQFEIVFRGPLNSITNPSSVIVIRERQARQSPDGGWNKAYAFADAHSEIHREKDGDFESFEKPRIVAPPNP